MTKSTVFQDILRLRLPNISQLPWNYTEQHRQNHWINTDIKNRVWKSLQKTVCPGHLKITSNSETWNILLTVWVAMDSSQVSWKWQVSPQSTMEDHLGHDLRQLGKLPGWLWWALAKLTQERALHDSGSNRSLIETKAADDSSPPNYGWFCDAADLSSSALRSDILTIPKPSPKPLKAPLKLSNPSPAVKSRLSLTTTHYSLTLSNCTAMHCKKKLKRTYYSHTKRNWSQVKCRTAPSPYLPTQQKLRYHREAWNFKRQRWRQIPVLNSKFSLSNRDLAKMA